MRIRPVKQYRPPPLPLASWNRSDPARHTERCGRLLRLMAGLGLLGSSFFPVTGRAGENAPAIPSPASSRPDGPPATGDSASAESPAPPAEASEAFFRMAPNLLAAMAREGVGHGAYGCIAVAPTTFVAEDDGIEIMRLELEKAGIKTVVGGPAAPGLRAAVKNPLRGRTTDIPDEPFVFDGRSEDGTVLFEFVSRRDLFAWNDIVAWSDQYNFTEVADRLADALGQTPDRDRRIVLLACDPAYSDFPRSGNTPTEEEKIPALVRAESHIRRQMAPQVDFLLRRGLPVSGEVKAAALAREAQQRGFGEKMTRLQVYSYFDSYSFAFYNADGDGKLEATLSDRTLSPGERGYVVQTLHDIFQYGRFWLKVLEDGSDPEDDAGIPPPDMVYAFRAINPDDPGRKTFYRIEAFADPLPAGGAASDGAGPVPGRLRICGYTPKYMHPEKRQIMTMLGDVRPFLVMREIFAHPDFPAFVEKADGRSVLSIHTVRPGDRVETIVSDLMAGWRDESDRPRITEYCRNFIETRNRSVLPETGPPEPGTKLLVPCLPANQNPFDG